MARFAVACLVCLLPFLPFIKWYANPLDMFDHVVVTDGVKDGQVYRIGEEQIVNFSHHFMKPISSVTYDDG